MDGMMESWNYGVLVDQVLLGYISFVHNSSVRSIERNPFYLGITWQETAVDCIFRDQVKSGKWPGSVLGSGNTLEIGFYRGRYEVWLS